MKTMANSVFPFGTTVLIFCLTLNVSAHYNLAAFWRSPNCPVNYVLIVPNPTLGTSFFCIAKFEMKDDGAGNAVSRAAGAPWVSISRATASTKCQAQGARLPFNTEWQAIARDIENTASNWTSGTVGTGGINRGHSDNAPANVIALTDETDAYNGTGNTAAQAYGSGGEQGRKHFLSNGGVIWDFAGNAAEWVLDDISGATLSPVIDLAQYYEFTATATFPVPGTNRDLFAPSNTAFDSVSGMGKVYGGTGGAVARGGNYTNTTGSGVFNARLSYAATATATSRGFRCASKPL